MKNTLFQYCPKIILFSTDRTKILLAKRRGEQDYDGVYGFIGGKSETTDESLLSALKREKDEEIGSSARVEICWRMSCYQVLFRKKDGNAMVLPHHIARFTGGDIKLNTDEYADYQWIEIAKLDQFEPKIANIPETVRAARRLFANLDQHDFDEI